MRRRYVGDEHVWRWYRGTGVGPYTCLSALQALERVCDQLIEIDIPLMTVVSILLDGCENLAMVGLVVGLLVRHLERAGDLLDSYLAEPFVWRIEVTRVVNESSAFAADSEGIVASERRNWSLREAALFMGVRADKERTTELRELGDKLLANARRHFVSSRDDELSDSVAASGDSIEKKLMPVRLWASCLDRDSYQALEASDGLYIHPTPPSDVLQALEPSNKELHRFQEATRLFVRYHVDPNKEGAQAIAPDELAADITIARNLLEFPPSLVAHDPWNTAALIAAAALEAHFLDGADLEDDALYFATETVLRVGEGEAPPRQFEFEETYFEQGADRTAARTLPLLLLPSAARLRASIDKGDGWKAFERVARAGVNLARAVSNEVRLHLARGLDHVWKTPCAVEMDGHCHHEVGWKIATETMRCCVLGGLDRATGRRMALVLEDPLTESLAGTDDDKIRAARLDAAIRALAPAAVAGICVSAQAHDLLQTLLAAQRRSLLSRGRRDTDLRGSHSLVSARALLTLAEHGDDAAIYEHIDAYADSPALLGTLLRALSATAEETPDRAATARRVWPSVIRHVLALNAAGRAPFRDGLYGEMALAALLPNAVGELPYLYGEVHDEPVMWWKPIAMQPEVEAWLLAAAGIAICVDRLISFLLVLEPEDQLRVGLPWVSKLALVDPARIAGRVRMLPTWLIEIRSAASDHDQIARWQEIVDALVVAGVTRLAPYSE